MKAPQGQWSPRYTGLALVVSGPGGRQLGGLVGLGAAKLQQGWVPVSAAGAGTGREGRKRRKSRNGFMVSTGFPVPPQEPELQQVQTAPVPAPAGRQQQPHNEDHTTNVSWKGCALVGY